MASESEDNEKIPTQVNGGTSIATPDSLHSDAAADRKAFLASFSPEEDKKIRRKVDWRFLWLIGMMYIIKNVSWGLESGCLQTNRIPD
jgi:hypothetical protein